MRAPIWTGTPTRLPLIGAHRGASEVAMENSAEAFEAAIATGADFIETDLRLSRDGVPVSAHDADLMRIAGDPRAIADLDMEELRAIHPGIVAMADVIDLVAGRASILLDTKLYERAALERCIEVLGSRTADGHVAFGVRSLDVFDIVHGHLPECPTLGLFADIGDYPALAARGGLWARLWEPDASRENIENLQRLGLKSVIMTGKPVHGGVGIIEPEALFELCMRGPDAIMINDPTLAVAAVARLSQSV